VEAGAALACLAAGLLVRLLRGVSAQPDSIWFGRRIVDGVLFPVLALLLALLARWVLPAGPAGGAVQAGGAGAGVAGGDPAHGAGAAPGLPARRQADAGGGAQRVVGGLDRAWCCGSPACCR
jgi:hypothetical protein